MRGAAVCCFYFKEDLRQERENRMNDSFDYAVIDRILSNYEPTPGAAIAVMQEVQEHFRYLPREMFPYVAKRLGMSEARLYSTATFYENFSLDPKGKYIIKVCDGTACHVRKSLPILERIHNDLGLDEGDKTTEDLMFTVEVVACLGACGLGPMMMVNEEVHPAMTPDKASELLRDLRRAEDA